MERKGIIEVETSRGIIRIVDDHVFEITVPVNDQLQLMFHGETTVFALHGWLQNAKETGHDGKRLDKPPHLMHNGDSPGGLIV